MCGRYQFTTAQWEEIQQIVAQIQRRYGSGSWTPGEICPSSRAPVLMETAGEIAPRLMQWGYPLPGTLVINARAESALTKPLFRESVKARRCLIPSTGFYEWDAGKRKYLFTLPGEAPLYMAGLYDRREGADRYCILTTQANPSMRPIHHRMPLVVTREQGRQWLLDDQSAQAILALTPPALLCTSAEAQLSLW